MAQVGPLRVFVSQNVRQRCSRATQEPLLCAMRASLNRIRFNRDACSRFRKICASMEARLRELLRLGSQRMAVFAFKRYLLRDERIKKTTNDERRRSDRATHLNM